jgi:hypothetical protein
MSASRTQLGSPGRLASALQGKVVIPEDARFDEARRAWNLAIDQRPAAVAFPESPQAVAAAVLFARGFGGHSAGPVGSLEDTILLKTEPMRGVSVDPARRTAGSRREWSGSRLSRREPSTALRGWRAPRPMSA